MCKFKTYTLNWMVPNIQLNDLSIGKYQNQLAEMVDFGCLKLSNNLNVQVCDARDAAMKY